MTYIGGEWWPQLSPVRVIPETENEWEVDVNFGIARPHKVYIVKASELGMELINFFRKLVRDRNQAIVKVASRFQIDAEQVRMVIAPLYWSLAMATLPKGLDMEDCIEINVTSLESRAEAPSMASKSIAEPRTGRDGSPPSSVSRG